MARNKEMKANTGKAWPRIRRVKRVPCCREPIVDRSIFGKGEPTIPGFIRSVEQTYHVQPSPRHGAETHEQSVDIVEIMDLRRSRVEYDTTDGRSENKVGIVYREWTESKKISHDRHT